MTETTTPETPDATQDGEQPTAQPEQPDEHRDGAPGDLGDAGKRALDAIRAERDQHRQAERDARSQLEAAQQRIATFETESQQHADALNTANRRVTEYAVRAAAAGRLADPGDALRFIDIDTVTGDDGAVDEAALTSAVDALLESKPYLAPNQPHGYGSGDQGSQADKRRHLMQVTREELATMTPDEINKARRAGRMKTLLGG